MRSDYVTVFETSNLKSIIIIIIIVITVDNNRWPAVHGGHSPFLAAVRYIMLCSCLL